MEVSNVHEFKRLRDENARFKKLLAERETKPSKLSPAAVVKTTLMLVLLVSSTERAKGGCEAA